MKRYEVFDHTAGSYCDPHEYDTCAECKRLNPKADVLYYLATEVDTLLELADAAIGFTSGDNPQVGCDCLACQYIRMRNGL